MKNAVRNLFRHAVACRMHPAAAVSAAVVAVAATSGGLLPATPATGPVNTADKPTVLRMVLATDGAAAAPAAPVPAAKPKAPAEKILGYNFEYQPNFYYCGPASARIALSGQGHTLSQDELATKLGTTVNGTNSSVDIARVMNAVIGENVYRVREIPGPAATPAEMDRLQADVVDAVGNGRILVANIVGGATDTSGYWRSFPGGHYVTIVGYSDDGRRVQVADPSGVGPNVYWMTTIGMAHWIAARGYSY